MKTRIRYFWLCTYNTAGDEKTVVIGNEKTGTAKFFSSQERALVFLRRCGLAEAAALGFCKCELKEVEV